MKFSIRLLFALTLLVALLLQMMQTAGNRKELGNLEHALASQESRCNELNAKVRRLHQETEISSKVLRGEDYVSEVYVAAKERFRILQSKRAEQ